MTDLNELVPTDSPLFLMAGGVINSRSEITGLALLKETTEVHAFLATPCGRDLFEGRDCEYETWDIPTAASHTSARPRITLPKMFASSCSDDCTLRDQDSNRNDRDNVHSVHASSVGTTETVGETD